tara:strand:+ start:14320 stop:14511 length:192 start_codon:yes stop_codon:yes gene_type:complete
MRFKGKMQEKLYKVEEIADKLSVKPSTVRGWIGKNKMKAFRVGSKTVRVAESSLNDFIQTNTK